MFEIATKRAEHIELIRLDVIRTESEREFERLISGVKRVLKNMRTKRQIQFFVSPEGFAEQTTETQFLLNKYSDYLEEFPEVAEGTTFFYIKL
jgi:hypothetical protein